MERKFDCSKELSGFVCKTLAVINTPKALSIFISIKYGEVYHGEAKPIDYLTADAYLADAQAVALVRKNPWIFPSSKALASAALGKFLESENRCSITNAKFRRRAFTFSERSLLESARLICHAILGDFYYGSFGFGPGSTLNLAGRDANIVRKLVTVPECTPRAYEEVMTHIIHHDPHLAISTGLLRREKGSVELGNAKPVIVDSNRFTTVPKDCRADRAICIEPSGNMLLQKAIGSSIRCQLRKAGLDLDKAQLLHEELAMIGSRDDSYATIDLSSASDTICMEFVRFMLPTDWFNSMNRVRCAYTLLPDGTRLFNEKFSSMGNGYTFELESLLFLCIARAIRSSVGSPSDVVSVFGDDIIVQPHLGEPLIDILSTCGFSVNEEKTFLSGPFRESCGKDFFLGKPVRPIYLKGLPNDRLSALYSLANRLRDLAFTRAFGLGCSLDIAPVWRSVVNCIPKHQRYFGPHFYGDDVLRSSTSEIRFCSSVGGILRIKRLSRKVNRKVVPREDDHVLVCLLYGIGSSGVSPRSSHCRIVTRYAPYFYGEGDSYSWV